jgi:ATPase subunit of ABC transporter with duplicated ATPase domains
VSPPSSSSPVGVSALLGVDALTLESTSGPLIREVSFVLSPSRRIGLVARNGGGKSTLIEALDAARHGRAAPAYVTVRGRIAWARGATCGFLPQHPHADDVEATAGEWLDARAGEHAALHARERSLAAAMADGAQDEVTLGAYGEVVHRLTALSAWGYAEQRERVLRGLGVDPESLSRPLGAVSGGEATRIALAGLLLARPDVLLLDEPTNNLDTAGVDFLRTWLRASTAALLLVSHDRDLLDDLADEILFVDEATHAVRLYGGNWSFAVAQRRVEFAAQVRDYEEQQARRAALLESAGVVAERAAGFQSMSQNDFYRALLGELPPRRGAVERPRDLRVAHLAQSAVPLGDGVRAVDVVRRIATVTEDDAHLIVAAVVFDDAGGRPMARFSAGERRRIELAAMLAARPELLALDEPSNHLDLPTLEMLEEALDEHQGALLLVTHDRRMLARVRPRTVLRLDGRGGLTVERHEA